MVSSLIVDLLNLNFRKVKLKKEKIVLCYNQK